MIFSVGIQFRWYGNEVRTTENYKQIDKCDVWLHLQAGKAVYAVILKSKNFRENIYDLRRDWSVGQINRLLSDKEKNIIFFEEIEV